MVCATAYIIHLHLTPPPLPLPTAGQAGKGGGGMPSNSCDIITKYKSHTAASVNIAIIKEYMV